MELTKGGGSEAILHLERHLLATLPPTLRLGSDMKPTSYSPLVSGVISKSIVEHVGGMTRIDRHREQLRNAVPIIISYNQNSLYPQKLLNRNEIILSIWLESKIRKS
jgi:hypothetical protein